MELFSLVLQGREHSVVGIYCGRGYYPKASTVHKCLVERVLGENKKMIKLNVNTSFSMYVQCRCSCIIIQQIVSAVACNDKETRNSMKIELSCSVDAGIWP